MKTIEGINIGNIELVFDGAFERHDLILGALTISHEDREFILDVVQSYTDTPDMTGDGTTRITCDIEVDEDTFDECPYNITKADILDNNHNDMEIKLWVDGDVENEIKSMTLYFEADGEDYQIKVEKE